MVNPFPGMNPYLEDAEAWRGLHTRLITYVADALQPQLSPNYFAMIEETVSVDNTAHRVPDVLVIERTARETTTTYAPDAVALNNELPISQPLIIDTEPVEVRERFIQIIRKENNQLVTVIEILSPSNKARGEGRRQYLTKQNELLESEVNLVELDLLAYGLPTLAVVRGGHSVLPSYRYLVNVRRVPYRYLFETYPIRLDEKLPHIRIPLVAPDPDVALDIQAVLNQAYDNGAYDRLLNYHAPPRTTLAADEAKWVDEILRAGNLR
ncbi:MAG: DUF4058 family protein [Chloroflexi bacterium]|nr:DUF4058 family protein [Chloroflexota bacterium]